MISLAGCAALSEMERKRQAREHLITAQELLAKRDYAGSLKANQRALSLYDRTPLGDEALFNTGLIFAHDAYPKKDYKKSLDAFKRLVNVFPQSPFAGQASIWIQVLQANEKSRAEVEELSKAVKECRQENQRLSREVEELNAAIHKSKQIDIEIDEKRKRLSQ